MLIPTPPAEPTPPPAVPTVIYLQHAPKAPSNPLATAAMACGIASVPLFFCCYLGIPLSLVALGLGITGYVRSNDMAGLGRTYAIVGMSLAGVPWVMGLVLGIVTLALR